MKKEFSEGFMHDVGDLLHECSKNNTDNVSVVLQLEDGTLDMNIVFSRPDVKSLYVTNRFKVSPARLVHQQRVGIESIAHHYENEGEPEYIKYSCPICEMISEKYVNEQDDENEQFKRFSFAKGTPQCPCCGINFEWPDEK